MNKKMKIQVTKDIFSRIGKLDNSEKYFDTWIPSPSSTTTEIKWNIPFHQLDMTLKMKK